MDVPPRSDKTASCPLNVPPPRSRRFSPFSHDLDSSPQQRRATRPLFRIPAFEAAALLPPFSLPRSFSPASLLPSCVLPERDRRAAQTTPLRAFFSRLRSARFLLPAPCSLISQAKTPVPRQCLFFPRARLPVFALRPHSAHPFACSASSLHPRRSSGHTGMLSSRSSPYAKGPPA